MTAEEMDRINFNLGYPRENPTANTDWALKVLAEARSAGGLETIHAAPTVDDLNRINRCLAWIATHPFENTAWANEVRDEAREVGLLHHFKAEDATAEALALPRIPWRPPSAPLTRNLKLACRSVV